MVAEDDVDVESLQAQIDMSMSFAHNLVMSWIKPAHVAQLRSSGVNATQVLDEELRRPPRLGVGASIPTAPLAHEASKLTRRLGKSGASNKDGLKSQPRDSSMTDHEEHKGRPAKRKARVDPFGHEGSKKKTRAECHPFVENVSEHSASLLKNPAFWEPLRRGSPFGKEEQRTGPDDKPLVRSPTQTTFSSSAAAPIVALPPEPSRVSYAPVPGRATTPASSRVQANSIPIPDTKLRGVPLLNLDGPPELGDQTAGNTSDMNNSRRKRKRRKKKKTRTLADTKDNSR